MVFEVTMLETDFDNLVEQVDTTRLVMVDGKEYYKDRAEFSDCTTKDTEQGKTKTCSFMLLQRESKAWLNAVGSKGVLDSQVLVNQPFPEDESD